MYKLYGVDSCYESGRQLNCVVLALSEEDAIKEFYKDVNCRNYAMIMGVHEIKGNKCTILYQLQREILDYIFLAFDSVNEVYSMLKEAL